MYYVHNPLNIFTRRSSNCNESDAEEATTTTDDVGVQESTPMEEGQGDASTETIVTPPDHMIAMELAEGPQEKTKQPSKAISLQETTKRIRTTPAAKKREDMAEKMFNLLQKEHQNDLQELEDEYELSFLSLARRANKYLNPDQKEDVLQEVEEIVRKAINVARKKRTDTPQPAANPTPPPAPVQTNHVPPNFNFGNPPPLVNAANLQPTMGQQQDYFNTGHVTFDNQTGQQLYQM